MGVSQNLRHPSKTGGILLNLDMFELFEEILAGSVILYTTCPAVAFCTKRVLVQLAMFKLLHLTSLCCLLRKPDVHIFGHTHFGWDMVLDGTRYVQVRGNFQMSFTLPED